MVALSESAALTDFRPLRAPTRGSSRPRRKLLEGGIRACASGVGRGAWCRRWNHEERPSQPLRFRSPVQVPADRGSDLRRFDRRGPSAGGPTTPDGSIGVARRPLACLLRRAGRRSSLGSRSNVQGSIRYLGCDVHPAARAERSQRSRPFPPGGHHLRRRPARVRTRGVTGSDRRQGRLRPRRRDRTLRPRARVHRTRVRLRQSSDTR